MTKSELIERISTKNTQLPARDIEDATKLIFEKMIKALEEKERIEIRGFGSFSLRYRKPREGRNPKTGAKVTLLGKYVPHFKPGKELRERVDQNTPQHAD
jgi:integration host factor subunit beta